MQKLLCLPGVNNAVYGSKGIFLFLITWLINIWFSASYKKSGQIIFTMNLSAYLL
jgi:hypothetical protein